MNGQTTWFTVSALKNFSSRSSMKLIGAKSKNGIFDNGLLVVWSWVFVSCPWSVGPVNRNWCYFALFRGSFLGFQLTKNEPQKKTKQHEEILNTQSNLNNGQLTTDKVPKTKDQFIYQSLPARCRACR